MLQPLAAMVAFSWVFGQVAGIPSDGLPYPVFVLAGVVPWFFISTAVSAAAESLVEHTDLVTRVWFPRLLAPIAAVLAAIVDLLIGLLLLAPVMADLRGRPTPAGADASGLALGRRPAGDGRGVLARRRQRALPGRPLRAHVPAPALALRQPGCLPDLARRRAVALPASLSIPRSA